MTVWELIQKLTADYIDPNDQVVLSSSGQHTDSDVTGVTKVSFRDVSQVRIEAWH